VLDQNINYVRNYPLRIRELGIDGLPAKTDALCRWLKSSKRLLLERSEKAEAPALEAVIQLLVEFLQPPLGAAAKGQSLRATWKSNHGRK
jgi:hypothetical protein